MYKVIICIYIYIRIEKLYIYIYTYIYAYLTVTRKIMGPITHSQKIVRSSANSLIDDTAAFSAHRATVQAANRSGGSLQGRET